MVNSNWPAMQTLWQYFRISLVLVAASCVFGVLAILGVAELEQRKPPDAIALKAIGPTWSAYRLNIRASATYRFDLELEALDTTPARLCEPAPSVADHDCNVPAGRTGIEWQIENDKSVTIAAGNLNLSNSRLYFGSYHWLELGRLDMSAGTHVLRLRRAVATNALDLPWARVRIWRGARDGAEASEEARRTANWVFATACTLLLTLFAAMLEYVVWKRQRAPR